MQNMKQLKKWTPVLLVILSRVIIHPPNFTALGAFAIMSNKIYSYQSLPITLLTVWISDMIVNALFYPQYFTVIGSLWIYLSYMLIALASRYTPLSATPIVSSVLFFIFSNFGVYTSGYYGYTVQGLVNCYTAAIPFFTYTILGDMVYTGLIIKILKHNEYEVIKNSSIIN